jgi:hypothetical protein
MGCNPTVPWHDAAQKTAVNLRQTGDAGVKKIQEDEKKRTDGRTDKGFKMVGPPGFEPGTKRL